MAKKGFYFLTTVFLKNRLLILMFAGLPLLGFAQNENEEDEKPNYTSCEDKPIFASFGPNISKIYGKEFPVSFDFRQSFEGGFLLKHRFLDHFPVYVGLEYQRKGYEYNTFKSGTTQNNKYFEDRIKGRALLSYLTFPFLVELPTDKPDRRFHFLAGFSMGLRVYYNEKFEGSRSFPKDNLVIPVTYEKTGNDALDFMEFNLCLGVKYKVLPRMEVVGLASLKGFGLSISKENFLTSTELNNVFAVKVLYRIASLNNLPFNLGFIR